MTGISVLPVPADGPRPVCTIDFEASCLPKEGSFPIEVAVAHPNGRVRAWLIRPTEAWLAHGVWDPESEAIHGLSRETLLAEGRPAAEVVAELADEVAGRAVISDHERSETQWLETLCEAAGVMPPFFIEALEDLIYPWLEKHCSGDVMVEVERMEAAYAQARARHLVRHRASPDAQCLMAFLQILTGQQNPPPPGR